MKRFLVLLIIVVFLPGCDALPFWPFGPEPTTVGKGDSALKGFRSAGELEEYFSQQVLEQNERYSFGGWDIAADEQGGGGFDLEDSDLSAPTSGVAPAPEAGDGGANNGDRSSEPGGEGHSGTTVQETGVDEADVVKTDGTYVYTIDGGALHIVRILPVEDIVEVAEVPLDGDGLDLYLHGDTIVALTATYGGFAYGDTWTSDGGDAGWETVVDSDEVGDNVDDGQPGSDGGEEAGRETTDPDDQEPPSEPEGDSPDGPEITPEPDVDDDPKVDDDPDSDDEPIVEPEPVPMPDEPPFVPGEYERPKTIVTIIDVSDRSAPQVLSVTRFEGSRSSSRMIDGVMHLLIANYPQYYYDVIPLLGAVGLRSSDIEPELLLPQYEQAVADEATVEGDMVTWRNLYRPTTPGGFGVVSVVSMDITDPASFEVVGVVAEPGLIYSSTEALYLTDTQYAWERGVGETRETTDIYKFLYIDGHALPVASGSVPGRILNQYSMGEYEGKLRVATTTGRSWWGGEEQVSTNAVYVLDQVEQELEVIGSVEGIAPRETIQSARFMGDRGYVVTFEQIDPLFTLDLSDPTNPLVVGELKVPGFSTFIVPMDADHLLTVGQYIPDDGRWNWGVQLSIFDISDFANPSLKHSMVIGEEHGAWSEALHDPKAFTYFAEGGLIALPVSISDYSEFPLIDFDDLPDGLNEIIDGLDPDELEDLDEDQLDELLEDLLADNPDLDSLYDFEDESFDGVMIVEVSSEQGFAEIGRISTRWGEEYWHWSRFTRGLFSGGNAYAATSRGVRGGPLDRLDTTLYEVAFESDSDDWPTPVWTEPGIEVDLLP